MSEKQKSIWSIDETTTRVNSSSTTCKWSNETSDDEYRIENTKPKRPPSMGLCIECCLVSSFLTAIILATIIALWLTSSSSNKTTTTTTTTSVLQSIFNTTDTTSAATAPAVTFDCSPVSVASASILYSTTVDISTTYQCFAYTWTAPSSKAVTLAFQFRHSSNYWYLDDVSVYQGSSQIIANGGFEAGLLTPWQRTLPNGNCVNPAGFSGPPGQVQSGIGRTSSYALIDGCKNSASQISQTFTATVGQSYTIVFWLKMGGSGSSKSANVTLM